MARAFFGFRLDFRRNAVSVGGTRQKWFEKFRENWLSIKLFDSFVTFLLSTNAKCFKPTYVVQRADGLSGINSPFTSARWLLGDYNVWGQNLRRASTPPRRSRKRLRLILRALINSVAS